MLLFQHEDYSNACLLVLNSKAQIWECLHHPSKAAPPLLELPISAEVVVSFTQTSILVSILFCIPPTDRAIDYSRGLCATSSHHKYMISSNLKWFQSVSCRTAWKAHQAEEHRCGTLIKNIFFTLLNLTWFFFSNPKIISKNSTWNHCGPNHVCYLDLPQRHCVKQVTLHQQRPHRSANSLQLEKMCGKTEQIRIKC